MMKILKMIFINGNKNFLFGLIKTTKSQNSKYSNKVLNIKLVKIKTCKIMR